MPIQINTLSHVGMLRQNNEDCVMANPDAGFAVLADGMGGYQAGEVASAMAVEGLAQDLLSWQQQADATTTAADLVIALPDMVQRVNQIIGQTAQIRPDCVGMGTTLVLAVRSRDEWLIGHVGDSRAYQWRAGTLTALTRDHSMQQELLEQGVIKSDAPDFASYRGLITRALGAEESVMIDTSVSEAQDGDVILLCSDGLTDMLTDEAIADVLEASAGDGAACAQQLIDAANAAGGLDNVTVALMKIGENAK